MSATLFDRPAVAADPACHACHGTGTDSAFGGSCAECHRGAPIRARFGDAPYERSERADRPQGNGTGTRSTSGPAPAADASSTDEASLADWLREQTWSDFAQSLAADYMRRGYFTPKQYTSAVSMRTKCEARRAERAAESTTATTTAPAPIVPAGWYALTQTEGAPVAFYRVDEGTGRWAGRTFVTRITGAQDYAVRGNAAAAVLAAIAADPDAGPRYGREIGSCCRCNRTLTDAASRAAGIGPYCAAKGV